MATSAEIRNKAAKKLGLLGTGQTLRSAISDDLDNAYTETYAVLNAKGLATWSSTGEVPNELVEPVVAWVAAMRVNEYSVPNDRYQRVMRDYTGDGVLPSAEARMRELVANAKVGTTKIHNY